MKLVKPLIVLGAAVLMVTSVATAGAATRQHDRQQLKDATCTTAVAYRNGAGGGTQTGTQAQDRQQLKDGSCVTTVAYRSGSRHGSANGTGTQNGTGAQDHQRLHDSSCLTA